jgi:alkyl sulfatase BDS1-like metallo-beta-lactamase superfamily hydrolase
MKRLLFCVYETTLQTSKFSSITLHFSLFQYTEQKYAVRGVDIGGCAVIDVVRSLADNPCFTKGSRGT